VDAVSGGLALYRRAALDAIGQMDDSYVTPGLCEDDLGVALWTKGWRVLCLGAVKARVTGAAAIAAAGPTRPDAEDLGYWRDRWGWDAQCPDLQQVRRLWGSTPLCREVGATLSGTAFETASFQGATGPDAEHPPVDILIPTYNSRAWLERCLVSLAETDYPAARITVLDNGSTDDTAEFLKTFGASMAARGNTLAFRSVRIPMNGLPCRMNWLLSITDAPLVARCDDDIVVPANWLAHLVETLRRHPYAGAVAPKVLNYGEPGTLQFGDIRIWPVNNYNHLIPDTGQCDIVTRTTHACVSCVVYRRRAFEVAGPYDIGFSPSQLDDLDHFIALRTAGYDVLYDGRVAVQHKINSGADRSRKAQSSHPANFGRLIGKWGEGAFEILESAIDRGGRAETSPVGVAPPIAPTAAATCPSLNADRRARARPAPISKLRFGPDSRKSLSPGWTPVPVVSHLRNPSTSARSSVPRSAPP
jgi:GT2 family glycosyltransferase